MSFTGDPYSPFQEEYSYLLQNKLCTWTPYLASSEKEVCNYKIYLIALSLFFVHIAHSSVELIKNFNNKKINKINLTIFRTVSSAIFIGNYILWAYLSCDNTKK